MKFEATLTAQNWRSSGRKSALINSRPVWPHTSAVQVSEYQSINGRFYASAFQRFTAPKARGFTLVEIMLALAIFTMLTACLYSTWVLIMKATTVGKGRAAQLQRERIAMQTLENSLTYIQSHQASIDYYLFDVQNGDQPLLSFTAYLPKDFPRSGEFLNNTPDGQGMDYHLRRLTYSLQADDNGQGKDLVLRQNPILMDLSPEEMKTPLILARNVNSFLVECWDTNAMQWDTEWDATNMLPPLVRVTLSFGDAFSGQPPQVITREVSFPSATMPTIVQTPNFNGTYQPSFGAPGNQGSPNGPPGSYNPYGGGAGSGGNIRPQSISMQGEPPDFGPPDMPGGSPSHAP
jgi:type II secretion system protein J